MTLLSIVSSVTTLKGKEKISLGEQDFNKFNIGQVRELIDHKYADLDSSKLQLWWQGYILDDDNLTIMEACVGVNGETIDRNIDHLVIFGTLNETSIVEHNREKIRPNSFDVNEIKAEFRKQSKKLNSCVIM